MHTRHASKLITWDPQNPYYTFLSFLFYFPKETVFQEEFILEMSLNLPCDYF